MKTLINPRDRTVRLTLSDGSERIVGPWSLAFLPEQDRHGAPLEVVAAALAPARTEQPGDGELEAREGPTPIERTRREPPSVAA